MCGIIGYKGNRKASEIVHEGLQKLEYRGYDSAGTAYTEKNKIKVEKAEGEVKKLQKTQTKSTTGIGHTRWATHGGVNETNAHPHTCHKKEVAVVHNGIIKNHKQLKQQIGKEKFTSDTDTEVIPHLIQKHLQKGQEFLEACKKVEQKLEGSYAVVATHKNGEIVAFKKDSPLVLGINQNEIFLASDTTPFVQHTETAKFLKNRDIVHIPHHTQHTIQNQKHGQVERETQKIEWSGEEITKEDHAHYMHKEIHEQQTTVKRAAFQDKTDIQKTVKLLEDAENIYLTGCGTSGFATEIGAKYLRQELEQNVIPVLSHELEHRKHKPGKKDIVIALSQSGETADLLAALEQTEAPIIAITNVKGSTLVRKSKEQLFINAGPEIGVASTKSFTGQIAVLKLLQYGLKDQIDQGRKSIIQTADKIEQTLNQNEETIEQISSRFAEEDNIYFIGRNKGYDVAKEADLKLKELTYIHSESFPGGEFKHGNISLVEEGTPVVSFIKETGGEEIISNTLEAQSRGADIIAVGQEQMPEFKHQIQIPTDDNSEILETIPFQLIAYRTSVKKGNNPDKPRNLAKSVTVK